MHQIKLKSLILLGLSLAGCHKCDLCCNVGGPCGAYSQAGRGSGPVPGALEMSAPAPTADAPAVPQNTTGAKPMPKPMMLRDSNSQTWR